MTHKLLSLFAASLLSVSALATPITWTPIGAGNQQWSNPSSNPVVIQKQIGNFTYGSDGSRSYNTTPQVPDATTYYVTPEGKTVTCKRYGQNEFCH